MRVTSPSTSALARVDAREPTKTPRACAQPAAASVRRSTTCARRSTRARAVRDRENAAYDALFKSFESAADAAARTRKSDRERDIVDALGLREAFEASTSRSKAIAYSATRATFGAEIELDADASVVYGYWTTPAALVEMFDALEACEPSVDGSRATCVWSYAYGDIARRYGRDAIDAVGRYMNVLKVTEVEQGSVVTFEAVAGLPLGATARVTAAGNGRCSLAVDVYVHMPVDVVRREGTVAVGLDVQDKFHIAMEAFRARVEAGDAASVLETARLNATEGLGLGQRADFNFTSK